MKKNQQYVVVLTNNFVLSAEDICSIVSLPLEIEIFFRWIKQHLKIKSFWGTFRKCSQNPDICGNYHIYLVAIIKRRIESGKSTYEILQILSFSLIDKTPN